MNWRSHVFSLLIGPASHCGGGGSSIDLRWSLIRQALRLVPQTVTWEALMDRRSFLTAMFGVAGAAALAVTLRPIETMAGVPGAGSGVLDELDAPQTEAIDEDPHAEVQQVYHRHWHHRRYHRRRGWRRVCRRYWRLGRRRVRCYRRRGPSVVLRF